MELWHALIFYSGFGRVELVQIASSSPLSEESSGRPKSYALKMMKKSHIVETRQQQVFDDHFKLVFMAS